MMVRPTLTADGNIPTNKVGYSLFVGSMEPEISTASGKSYLALYLPLSYCLVPLLDPYYAYIEILIKILALFFFMHHKFNDDFIRLYDEKYGNIELWGGNDYFVPQCCTWIRDTPHLLKVRPP